MNTSSSQLALSETGEKETEYILRYYCSFEAARKDMKDYCAREGLANSPLHTDQKKNSSNQGKGLIWH